MNEELDGILRDLSRDGTIYYIPNRGNSGDALISVGACLRFQDLGIRTVDVSRTDLDLSGRNVVYSGGGNLVPGYAELAECLAANHSKVRNFVLLPHTVIGHEELLSRLGPNVVIFCRELPAFQHCKKHATGARVLLGHDMAIHPRVVDLKLPGWSDVARVALRGMRLKLRRDPSEGPLLRDVVRISTLARKFGLVGPGDRRLRKNPVLDAFRQDVEATGRPIPPGNLDISGALALRSIERRALEMSAGFFLGVLRGHRLVRTDRLHVCIAAAQLGIEVEFHANSSHKCRSVWEFSLKDRFPNVRWAD